jgi:hypothetical protein
MFAMLKFLARTITTYYDTIHNRVILYIHITTLLLIGIYTIYSTLCSVIRYFIIYIRGMCSCYNRPTRVQ